MADKPEEDPWAEYFPQATEVQAPPPVAPVGDPNDPLAQYFPQAQPSEIDLAFTPVELVDSSQDQVADPSVVDLMFMAPTALRAMMASREQDFAVSDAGQGRLDTFKQYTQAAAGSLANAMPFGIGDDQVRQIPEVVGQIPSALLEQLGQVSSELTGLPYEETTEYKLARVIREATRVPDAIMADWNTFDNFTHGMMQTGAFFGGGKAAATVIGKGTKAAAGIAAWLGSMVGGQAGREDAIRFGAEDWQVDSAYYWNSLFGLSEGMPINLAMGRLDDITGGFLTKRIKSKVGQMVAGGSLSAIEEALQEGFQTWGENYTAKDLAAYDPARSLTDNIGSAATTGGSVGMLMGLLASGLGIQNKAARLQRANEYSNAVYGVDAEQLWGPATPLEDGYLQLMAGISRQQGIIDERGAERPFPLQAAAADAVIEAETRTNIQHSRLTPQGSESLGVVEQALAASTPRRLTTLDEQVLSEVEGAPEGTTVAERLDQTPVVSVMSWENQSNEALLRQLDKKIAEIEAKDAPIQDEIDALPLLISHKAALEARNKAEVDMSRSFKTLFEKLLPLMDDPSYRVAFGNGFGMWANASASEKDSTGFWNAMNVGPERKLTHTIYLKTERYMEAIAHNVHPSATTKARVKREKSNLITAALHEFGHGLAFHRIQGLAEKVQTGQATEEERTLFQGIANDYDNWLIKNLNSPFGEAAPSVLAIGRALSWTEAATGVSRSNALPALLDKTDPVMQDFMESQVDTNYMFSFQEFLAEQFAISAQMESETRNVLKQDEFYAEILDEWSQVQRTAKGVFHTGTPTLKALIKKTHLRQIAKEAQEQMAKVETNPLLALAKAETAGIGPGLIPKEVADRLTGEIDKFNWFYDLGLNIYQIAEKNPNLAGLQSYLRHLEEWKNEVNQNLAVAEDTLTEWKNLGKKENEQLARLLYDETIGRLPDGGWLKTPRAFTAEELAKYKLSEAALAIRAKINASFRRSLNEMETVLIAAKARIFSTDALLQGQEIAKVRKEFKDMRARPYFPLMRFGDYTLQVRARGDQTVDGRTYKDGELVDYQTFDTKKERDKARGLVAKGYVSEHVTVSVSHRTVPNFSLQGMPMTLIEHLENKLVSATEHSPEVAKAIQEVKNDALPFRSFRKQFQRRKRVEGYSLDAQRSYANYMTSFSNHIARVKYDQKFKQDFDNIENSIKIINRSEGGDSTKRAKILNHMNEHLNYVMNPVNELVGLRSAAFVWFLGYNVKSAFINLSQIPLITYPNLAARFGDGKAVAELTRAYKTSIQAYMDSDKVSQEIKDLVNKGVSESWLDESLATELALAASEGNLEATLPSKMGQKVWLKIAQYGSLPFHAAEKLNRHVAAIAAYRLARAEGQGVKRAQATAREVVQQTQFEYARYARPKFMRGKVLGTVFVFQNYMQNALWAMLKGDAAAFRTLIMLFLIAGLQGLPFGDNIMDLVDAMMSFYRKKTGVENPQVQIRVELRELLNELDVNPDLILHGTSASTFGLANIGEYMGWPIPSIDLSGSLSMGRAIPGTELLAPGQADTFERAAASTVERAGGAIASAGAGIGSALFNNHPDTWKAWEKGFPAAMRNVSKAARMAVRGEEATRGGVQIAGFNMTDPQDQMALALQGLGFPSRKLTKGWEGYIAAQQSVIYYKSWSDSLMRNWNHANYTGDHEAVMKFNSEIRSFNRQVPFGDMKIGPDTRRASWESYVQSRRLSEHDIEKNKRFRSLSDSILKVFEDDDN